MWIVCLADNSHEMLSLISSEKIKCKLNFWCTLYRQKKLFCICKTGVEISAKMFFCVLPRDCSPFHWFHWLQAANFVLCFIIFTSVFQQTDQSKQSRPRSDTTDYGILSKSVLFAIHPTIKVCAVCHSSNYQSLCCLPFIQLFLDGWTCSQPLPCWIN